MWVKYGPNCLIGKVSYRNKIIVLGSRLFSKSHVHLRKYYGIRHATRRWDYSQQVDKTYVST